MMWCRSHSKRHAGLTWGFASKLDKPGMLDPLARLRGSALRGRALARGVLIASTAIAICFADSEKIYTADAVMEQKPFTVMNYKLYLHNKINNWDEFECANWLGIRESNWRPKAVNKDSGAYGIFQHMSNHATKWDAYEQIDKHIEYIDARYNGSWCAALRHLEDNGWH